MMEEAHPFAAERRREAERGERLRKFTAQQMKVRKWISFRELARWEANGTGNLDEARRDQTYRFLMNSLVQEDFVEGGRSRVHVWNPAGEFFRLDMPDALRIISNFDFNTLRDGYFQFCWVPRALARRWCELRHVEPPPGLAEPEEPVNERQSLSVPMATPAMPQNVYATGAQGRPTSMHLIAAELERRSADGKVLQSQIAEATALAAWLINAHPNAPQVSARGIENSLRTELREAVKAAQSKTPTK